MKLLLVILVVVTLASGSLLDLSQVVWSKVLDGGYRKVGRVDPLFIPVIKVDQSEGNTTYKVILRNLTVTGLNASTIESVHVVRGKLKSNLSDNEAGYVSYNEQKGLDSIRYRFHTLVKEPKGPESDVEQRATEQFERIVKFNPSDMQVSEQEDLLTSGGPRFRSGVQRQEIPGNDRVYNFNDMRVLLNPTPRNPAQVRVAYSYANQQLTSIRPCIGACRPSYLLQPQKQQQEQQQFSPDENVRARVYPNQRYGERVTDAESSTDSYSTTSQRPSNIFSIKGGGNSGPQFSGSFGNGKLQVESQNSEQRPNQFSAQVGSSSGVQFTGNVGNNRFELNRPEQQTAAPRQQNQFYAQGGSGPGVQFSGNFGNNRFPMTKQQIVPPAPATQYPNQYSTPGSDIAPGEDYPNQFANGGEDPPSVQYPTSFGNGRFVPEGPSGNPFRGPPQTDTSTGNFEATAQFDGVNPDFKGGVNSGMYYPGNFGSEPGNREPFYSQNIPYNGFSGQPIPFDETEYRFLCGDRQDFRQPNFGPGPQSRSGAGSTTPSYEEFKSFKSPLIRIEKQPGYVDIVYVGDSKRTSESRRSEDIKAAPGNNSAGFLEIIRDLNGNQRYMIRNFTEGESLKKRNDAIRVASESKRIQDIPRYANNYQENQGYYEEGMELVYHFGEPIDSSKSDNETLTRKKRQQINDTEDEDVMHVIVRMQIPKLDVKANYALLGRVGQEPLRGAGLLDGNFTNVTADFTIELKRVNNQTMVVRAARAKLVSKDQNIKLQGMDEKGPVSRILSHGLMAAEAVAAMIADDLSSKALNEGNNEAMIYKMYKSLPVVEKS